MSKDWVNIPDEPHSLRCCISSSPPPSSPCHHMGRTPSNHHIRSITKPIHPIHHHHCNATPVRKPHQALKPYWCHSLCSGHMPTGPLQGVCSLVTPPQALRSQFIQLWQLALVLYINSIGARKRNKMASLCSITCGSRHIPYNGFYL